MERKLFLPLSIVLAAVILAGAWVYAKQLESANVKGVQENYTKQASSENLEDSVLPADGVVLPVQWEDLGQQMIASGVINPEKFESLYAGRGGFFDASRELLYEVHKGELKMDKQNAGVLLNLFWAFGLANKNPILEEGPMIAHAGEAVSSAEALAKAGRFASTGGWTLAKGGAMEHYSRHSFVPLTPEQQELGARVSQNIYHPCCGNSVHFPDCNHGMAMLGLLELMASEDVGEEEIYEIALQVNSYWFPETYLTIAKYFDERGISWDGVSPKEILGREYSSGAGYQQVLAAIEPAEYQGGRGCGV